MGGYLRYILHVNHGYRKHMAVNIQTFLQKWVVVFRIASAIDRSYDDMFPLFIVYICSYEGYIQHLTSSSQNRISASVTQALLLLQN